MGGARCAFAREMAFAGHFMLADAHALSFARASVSARRRTSCPPIRYTRSSPSAVATLLRRHARRKRRPVVVAARPVAFARPLVMSGARGFDMFFVPAPPPAHIFVAPFFPAFWLEKRQKAERRRDEGCASRARGGACPYACRSSVRLPPRCEARSYRRSSQPLEMAFGPARFLCAYHYRVRPYHFPSKQE